MDIQDFTVNSEAYTILQQLHEDKIGDRIYSDVTDQEGRQYVDLVCEGGGVLGIALVGYTWILEQVGIRFFSLAGTSAGAINALLLAGGGTPDQSRSPDVLMRLAEQDLLEFVDGPGKVRKTIFSFLRDRPLLKKIWYLARSLGYIKRQLGMNPGDAFYRWLDQQLQDHEINTTEQLKQQIRRPDGVKLRPETEGEVETLHPKLALIATDVTTQSRIQFPEMAQLYWNESDKVPPAQYVRASMSVPYFFEPVRIPLGKEIDPDRKKAWYDMVGYKGRLPDEAVLVDGGIVSNFPIDVFHVRDRVPRLPTFGVKLGDDRNKPTQVGSLGKLGLGLFNAARHIHDYEFILRNEDYRQLVSHIDVGNHNWLNFSITDEAKVDLFVRGAKAADRFLRTFDWDKYKDIRKKKLTNTL